MLQQSPGLSHRMGVINSTLPGYRKLQLTLPKNETGLNLDLNCGLKRSFKGFFQVTETSGFLT